MRSPLRDGRTDGADAVRYCERCNAWTGHQMQADGSYVCRIDHPGGSA